jgi:lysophospholipase L1-like esterase
MIVDESLLGGSYTAAPLVPTQVGQPKDCVRSDRNYPSIVAAVAGASQVRDVSCTSATTDDLAAPQPLFGDDNPPQFDALDAATRLVTIGIGGNDVGLVGAAISCLKLGVLAPAGTACRSSYARPGGDRLADRIAASAPKIAAALEGIHDRSPRARALIVGYPAVAPRDGPGCYPLVPLSDDDISYLDEMLRATNAMIAEQAAKHDAEYVDTYDDSVGHDACTLPGTRWFEGLAPSAPALPIHPNALGEASMARSVLGVLGRPRPAPDLGDLRRAQRRVRSGRAVRLSYRLSRPATLTLTLRCVEDRAARRARRQRDRDLLAGDRPTGRSAASRGEGIGQREHPLQRPSPRPCAHHAQALSACHPVQPAGAHLQPQSVQPSLAAVDHGGHDTAHPTPTWAGPMKAQHARPKRTLGSAPRGRNRPPRRPVRVLKRPVTPDPPANRSP